MVDYYEFLELDKNDLITDEMVKEKSTMKEIALWREKNDIARQILKLGNNDVKVKELKEEKKQIDEQLKILSKARNEIGTEAARNNYNKLLEESEKNVEVSETTKEDEKDLDDVEDVYSTEKMRASSEAFMEAVRKFKENNKNITNEINEKIQSLQEENYTVEQLKSIHNQNHAKRMAELEKEQEELTRIKYGMDLDEKKLSKLARIINEGRKELKDIEKKYKEEKKNLGFDIGDE